MLNDSLGDYRLTTKDGKIAYYQVSEGADSAIPFKTTSLPWLKNIPDEGNYFLVYANGQGGQFYVIDTNGFNTLHIEHYSDGKVLNIRIYPEFLKSGNGVDHIAVIPVDGGTFDISDRNDLIYLRFWGSSYGVYKIYVS